MNKEAQEPIWPAIISCHRHDELVFVPYWYWDAEPCEAAMWAPEDRLIDSTRRVYIIKPGTEPRFFCVGSCTSKLIATDERLSPEEIQSLMRQHLRHTGRPTEPYDLLISNTHAARIVAETVAYGTEDPESWSKAAQSYDAEHRRYMGEALDREIRAWLAQQLGTAEIVLELGCGTGQYSVVIAENVKHLVATDLSPEMLEEARKKLARYGNVQTRRENAYRTSFQEGAFDGVVLVNLLHGVDAPTAVATECCRVLTAAGRIVTVDHISGEASFLRSVGEALRRTRRWFIRYVRRRGLPQWNRKSFSPDALVAVIEEAGFVVEELRSIGETPKFVCLRGRKGT